MISFGIMQGRLTPSKGRGIQFFPFDNWENEFFDAKELGLDEIEWIFDYENFEKNPLWSEKGVKRIKELQQENDVIVKSVCWDYFMRRPFYKKTGKEYEECLSENKHIFETCINGMKLVGATLIEIPLVDDSSIKNIKERNDSILFIRWACKMADEFDITVGLETDFAPGIFKDYLDEIDCDNLKSNYDSGNSSGIGYDAREEILSLNQYVYNVHIKDRLLGNGTMELGEGSADFNKVFGSLKDIGYNNSFILQAARGVDGEEKKNIKKQLKFVKDYLKKYTFIREIQ